MLAALVTHLRVMPSPEIPVTGQAQAFDRMGLDFWIDNRGISIIGRCASMLGADIPGAMAVAGGRALLTQPAAQPQPIAALIQALVPANEVPVPATRQTGWLARLLPIPDAARTKYKKQPPARISSTSVSSLTCPVHVRLESQTTLTSWRVIEKSLWTRPVFFATLRPQVLFFPGDLFAKELCRDCVRCLVSSLLHPVVDVLRGRVAECRVPLHRTTHPSAGGVAASKAKPGSSWSLFPAEPKKMQTPSDFIAQPRPQ